MRGRKGDDEAVRAAKTGRAVPKSQRAKPEPGQVIPPKWMKRSRAAQEVWNELAPLLTRINALTQLDAFPLARYCRYVVDWIAADRAVQKEGVFFDATDTNGQPTKKRHPAFHARQDLDRMMREIEGAFGMRPDARFKMIRDQSLVNGIGPLFGGEAPQPAMSSEAASNIDPNAGDDPIGALARLDSAPPGSRPN